MYAKTKLLVFLLAVAAIFAIGVLLWQQPFKPQSYRKDVAAQADLTGIATQLEVFRREQGRYPSSEEGLDILVHPPQNTNAFPNWYKYLPSIGLDPWSRPYHYSCPGTRNPDKFDLYSVGPDGIESADDIYPSQEPHR